jgi:6-phosphofructo-2-kinase/fructose-2,6-biphosphatase 2/6-phosphofructo-2-kinase/fructose-2,6-biphosphatase 4
MVGIPGRGKTFLARKLGRYLNWIHYTTRVFNVDTYRQNSVGVGLHADFYSEDNKESTEQLRGADERAIRDLFEFLKGQGEVGILDR